jgi:hypothetical protein
MATLTTKEYQLLTEIYAYYDEDDFEGYTSEFSPSQKGVLASLIKKGLVVDCSDYEDPEHNYKPTPEGQVQMNTLGK